MGKRQPTRVLPLPSRLLQSIPTRLLAGRLLLLLYQVMQRILQPTRLLKTVTLSPGNKMMALPLTKQP